MEGLTQRIRDWYANLGRLGKIAVGVGIVFVTFVVLGAIIGGTEETQTQSSQTETQEQPQPNQQEQAEQGQQAEQEQQEALEQAQQEAEQARAEVEAAQEEAAQARREAEEAQAAQEEAESSPPPQQNEGQQNQQQSDSGGSTATIRVTGGIPFSGSYGNIDTTQSVDGVAPTEYEVEYDSGFLSMDSVTAVMQKNGVGGTLGVQIVVDGEVVKETETSAQYGVAQVNWTPGE